MRHRPLLPSLAAAALGLGALVLPWSARAIDPALQKAVERGGELFRHESFSGSGRVCNTCHLEGGTRPGQLPNGEAIPSLRNAAAIFPRVRERDHALITLPDQIRGCVAGGLQGRPPEYGSENLNALVSYVTSLSQGQPIDMGGAAH